ncbi:MAG: reverse transcriptase family protein [Hyphomicrobiaceae bacterium]
MGLFGWISRRLDPGHTIEDLASRLKVDPSALKSLAPRYHSFRISKRSGGFRTIDAPDQPLKRMQRLILRRLLTGLKTHHCVFGFERGRSIVDHAQQHCGQAVVIRLDIVGFFPSTSSKRLYQYFRFIGWNRKASRLLVRLTTHKGHLPQGAPTSPRLSNLVNFRLDARLEAMLRQVCGSDARFSRYADDLTFSIGYERTGMVEEIIRNASKIVGAEGYRLHRKKKTHILRSHQRQIIAGLVVNETVNLPRETRRWLRAVEHRARHGRDATLSPAQRAGWRSLLNMIHNQRNKRSSPHAR